MIKNASSMRIIHDFSPCYFSHVSLISHYRATYELPTGKTKRQFKTLPELRQNLDRCAVLFGGSKVAFPELTTRFL